MTSQTDIVTLAIGMADLAAKHPNDTISNALSRVSQKLENHGAPFAEKLTDVDKQVIAFYMSSVQNV